MDEGGWGDDPPKAQRASGVVPPTTHASGVVPPSHHLMHSVPVGLYHPRMYESRHKHAVLPARAPPPPRSNNVAVRPQLKCGGGKIVQVDVGGMTSQGDPEKDLGAAEAAKKGQARGASNRFTMVFTVG